MSKSGFLAAGVASAILSVTLCAPASAGPSTDAVSGRHEDLQQSFAQGREATSGSATVSPQDTGPFTTNGDYVHISPTAPATASAHGWWNRGTLEATTANVTVQLQIQRGSTWYNIGSAASKIIPPGGGSAARTTARVTCKTYSPHYWRSVVDVDLIGYYDTDDKLYTPAQSIGCNA